MAEVGKLTVISFIAASICLLLGRVFDSRSLFWTSIILFIVWVLCWVIEDIFDVVLWK
jgi:hypothetical protein